MVQIIFVLLDCLGVFEVEELVVNEMLCMWAHRAAAAAAVNTQQRRSCAVNKNKIHIF